MRQERSPPQFQTLNAQEDAREYECTTLTQS